jgi:hypothetical protein
MTQTQKMRAVGVLLVILGITTLIVGIVTLFETRWVVEPLHYADVRYLRGYRTSSTIHVIATDGRIYRLPQRLLPNGFDGPALASRLREERTAIAHVSGGESPFWFGYPTIDSFETSTLKLEAAPLSRTRAGVALILGPALAVGGVLLVRRQRGRQIP